MHKDKKRPPYVYTFLHITLNTLEKVYAEKRLRFSIALPLVCISQNNIDNKNFNKEIKTSNNETVDFFSTASKFIKDPKKEVTALVV